MIAYASRTGTRRNLAALRKAGWRLIVSAAGVWRTEGFGWAADNGAWSDFMKQLPFNEERFERFLVWVTEQPIAPDFIVLPDIVLGGEASLNLSLRWLRKLRRRRAFQNSTFALFVQNGMEQGRMLGRIKRMTGPKVIIFIGGDTEWKEATARFWAALARRRGSKVHVGRVNTARRIHICEAAGVDSFDGSSASRFANTLPPLDLARRQVDLEGHLARLAA